MPTQPENTIMVGNTLYDKTTGQPYVAPTAPVSIGGWQPPTGSTLIPSMDVLGQYTNVVSKPSSPDLYGVLTSASLKPQESIQVPQYQQDSSLADAVAAGTASYADYLKLFTAPKTETSTQYDTLMSEINKLLPEAGGRGAMQLAAEQAGGIPDLSKQLADINAQMLTKVAEYNVLEQKTKQRQTTTDVIYGEIVHQKNQMGSEMGLLQARALGLQGQLDAAQKTANRAVDLKYQDIEDQINIKLKQLNLLEGRMNKEETARANALTQYLNDQRDKIKDQKDSQKDALKFALENRITQSFFKMGDNIYKTSDGTLLPNMEEALKAGVKADLSNVQDMSAPQDLTEWTEPYLLGGDWVQKNLITGQMKNVVNVPTGGGGGGDEGITTTNEIDIYAQSVASGQMKITSVPQKIRSQVIEKTKEYALNYLKEDILAAKERNDYGTREDLIGKLQELYPEFTKDEIAREVYGNISDVLTPQTTTQKSFFQRLFGRLFGG